MAGHRADRSALFFFSHFTSSHAGHLPVNQDARYLPVLELAQQAVHVLHILVQAICDVRRHVIHICHSTSDVCQLELN